ncbi:MAG: type II secretion system protein [Phycisphaerae bacterium]|jgi:prepilin-type N-terminal cleavage/methylation domain-containing protein
MARRAHNKAFSFVELLVVLALMGLLLGSVAVGMRAMTDSYQQNQGITAATQAARYGLTRMMQDVRTADELSVATNNLTIIPPPDGNGTTQINYQLTGGTLMHVRQAGASTYSSPLVGGDGDIQVTAFDLTRLTETRGTLTYTQSLTARITLTSDGKTYTTSATGAVRRNQEY